MSVRTTGASRAELIADTALALLAERGMRGLTHRAVDEAAGLPQGSTSNLARTRLALLELAVRRLADREARVLALHEMPTPEEGLGALVDGLALATHRSLTRNRELTLARYELALEATRRPELRQHFDAAGARFRNQLTALVTAMGSTDPARHALSLV
ncbi:TetR/AcrR family transcriptional regulator, partial [Streptomyces colonosanans]